MTRTGARCTVVASPFMSLTRGRRSSVDRRFPMSYKFQQLEIYRLALDYIGLSYELSEKLPGSENFNLKSQNNRAATSIALNIAEGSTSQSDAEQSRFLGMALRSLVETVACQDIIELRKYATADDLHAARELGSKLFAKIQSMKRFLGQSQVKESAGTNRSSVAGRRS
jgi:four helix bundle protein